MHTERGEVLILAAVAFIIFVAVLAVGIAVDQWMHDPPCDPAVQACGDEKK